MGAKVVVKGKIALSRSPGTLPHAGYALAGFSLLAALLFHAYWSSPADQHYGQFLNFWKNVTIAGGMLMLAAFGPGKLSIEGRRGA